MGLTKQQRQQLLTRFVTEQQLTRQSDIVACFVDHGENVTQATVSRDIAALGLIKLTDGHGNSYYHLPTQTAQPHRQRLQAALQRSFLSMRVQLPMGFIKVQPGTGPLISKLFERVDLPDIFAVMSDDDSVLLILRQDCSTTQFQELMRQFLTP